MIEYTITFAIYFLIILAIVYISYRMTDNMSDYVLGGRRLNGLIAAFGVGASDMGSWLLMALPGAVYLYGLNQIWLPIGLSIGAFINWQYVSERLRIYTELAGDALTIPAYFSNRFHDKSDIMRSITAIIVLIFFTFYTAGGFVSAALLFHIIFHTTYFHGLLIGATVVVAYTCIGGFLGISWIDLFQGCLMLFALILVPIVTFSHIGNYHHVIHLISQIKPHALNAYHNVGPILLISLLGWGLGYMGQPHILVRFMATKTHRELPKAQLICVSWMNIALYGAIFTGLGSIAYFGHNFIAKPETAFLLLTQSQFGNWLSGIVFAAVLSAVMSTTAAQLLASASAAAEDLYHPFVRKNSKEYEHELVWVGRICVIIIAIIACIIAAKPGATILSLVAHAWAGLGAAFGPAILISLFWRRTTFFGVIIGMILSTLTVIIWPELKSLSPIFQLYEIVPGFIVGVISIFCFSLLSAKPSMAIQQQFNQVRNTFLT